MDEKEKSFLLQYIFGYIFLVGNRLQTVMDELLAPDDLTTRQWYMLAVIDEFFDSPPTLSEAADRMGSSHQNARRMAEKLEEKGYLEVQKDASDRRTLRLVFTEKMQKYKKGRYQKDQLFFRDTIDGCTDDDLRALYTSLCKIEHNVARREGIE